MRDLAVDQIGFAASSGPVERYFPLARRLGLRWLEFACQNPVNFPQTFDRARIRRVRGLVERSGVRCGLHSASFVNTAEIMPPVRRAAEAHLREYVDLTRARQEADRLRADLERMKEIDFKLERRR